MLRPVLGSALQERCGLIRKGSAKSEITIRGLGNEISEDRLKELGLFIVEKGRWGFYNSLQVPEG